MIAFLTVGAVLTSTWTKIVASFVAGSATVRAWFKKEIAAGKAELAKIDTAVVADVKKVEAKVKAEVDKVL